MHQLPSIFFLQGSQLVGRPSASADAAPDIKHMEGLLPKNYGADAVEIPGARDLLRSVTKDNIPWAIVTSGTTPLVLGW